MSDEPVSDDRQLLLLALDQLQAAIGLLDQGGAPGHIAAHVDLAINQLADAIGIGPAGESIASDREEHGAPPIR